MTYTDFIRTFTHLEVKWFAILPFCHFATLSSFFAFLIFCKLFLETQPNMQVVHLDAETARDEPSMQGKSRWRQLLLLLLCMLLLLLLMVVVVHDAGAQFLSCPLQPPLLLHCNAPFVTGGLLNLS